MKTFTPNVLFCFLLLCLFHFPIFSIQANTISAPPCDVMGLTNITFSTQTGCPGSPGSTYAVISLDVDYPISGYTLEYEVNYSGSSVSGSQSSFNNAFEFLFFSGFGQPATIQLFDQTNGCQSNIITVNVPHPGYFPMEVASPTFETQSGCAGSPGSTYVTMNMDIDYLYSNYDLSYEINYAGITSSGSQTSFNNAFETVFYNGFGQTGTIQFFDQTNGCQSEVISFNIPDPGYIPMEATNITFDTQTASCSGDPTGAYVTLNTNIDYMYSGYTLDYEINYSGGSASGSQSSFNNVFEASLYNGFGQSATLQFFDRTNGCQSEIIPINIPYPTPVQMEIVNLSFSTPLNCATDIGSKHVTLNFEVDYPMTGYDFEMEVYFTGGHIRKSISSFNNILEANIFVGHGLPATLQIFDHTNGCQSEVININIPEALIGSPEVGAITFSTSGCPGDPPGSIFTVAKINVDYLLTGYELGYELKHGAIISSDSEFPTDNELEIYISQGFGAATLQLFDNTNGCEGNIININIPQPQPIAPEVGSYSYRQIGCPDDPLGTAFMVLEVEVDYPTSGYNLGYELEHGAITSAGVESSTDNILDIYVSQEFGAATLQLFDEDTGCAGPIINIDIPELSDPKIIQYNLEQFGCPLDPSAYTALTVDVIHSTNNYTLGYELYLGGVLAQSGNENPTDNILEINIQNYAGPAELVVIDLDNNCVSAPLVFIIPEIEDNEPPVIYCPNGNFNFSTDDFYCTTFVSIQVPQTADNCGVVSLVNDFNGSNNASGNYPQGETIVTWTVKDIDGNTAACSVTVNVLDDVAPIVICQDISVALDENGTVSIEAEDITTIMMDNCEINAIQLSQSTFDCTESGENTVSVTVSDKSGLSSSCVATITILDSDAHDFYITPFVFLDLDEYGMASLSAADLNNTGSGICTSYSLEISPNTFDCEDTGSAPIPTTVTVTFSDDYSATYNIWVFVKDRTIPEAICQDITLELDQPLFTTITPQDIGGSSWDACGITTMTLNRKRFNCATMGPNEVILTVQDEAGNKSSCTAVVNVIDDELPSPCGGGSNYSASTTNNLEAVQVNVSKNEVGKALSVFPNPASTFVQIDIKLAEISTGDLDVFDQNGQIVYQNRFNLNHDFSDKINTADWAPGLYVVRIKSDSGATYHHKLVVVKD